MHSLDPVLDWLTARVSRSRRLDRARDCSIDLTLAPEPVRRLIEALRNHDWDVDVGEYHLRGDDDRAVESLRLTLESLEADLDHELDVALAQAGADGGQFDPDASVELCPDRGGMTVLALSWSGSVPSFVVVELEEDPNADGLLTHLTTPGAVLEYLRGTTLAEEFGTESLDDLSRAVVEAGGSLDSAEPVRSRAPTQAPTRSRELAVGAPSIDVYGVASELSAAIAIGDLAGVDRALAELGRGWDNSLALLQALRAVFEARDSRPALAVRIADFIVQRPPPRPDDPMVVHEWLGGLLNATAACTQLAKSDPDACTRVVATALEHGAQQPALFHNLACFMALRGDGARTLEMVELAARHGYADLPALLADDDLSALRADGALEAAVARGRSGGAGRP
ncbi:MAG: hypothetical protein IPM35_36160 [Myxococcales bacterium]|nr:hypothetical protein [Myxococcales bacterium]